MTTPPAPKPDATPSKPTSNAQTHLGRKWQDYALSLDADLTTARQPDATPRTDAVSRSIESDGMLLTNRGAVSLDQAHDFAASAVKKMSDHARQLERDLTAARLRCGELTEQLDKAREGLSTAIINMNKESEIARIWHYKYFDEIPKERQRASQAESRLAAAEKALQESECICKGNWRLLVGEERERFGKKFRDEKGGEWTFYGLVHADDDYYYGMYRKGEAQLLSCVGSIEGYGFTQIDAATGGQP